MDVDPTAAKVSADILARSEFGIQKYGVGLGVANLSRATLLQHAYEEALDLACYLQTLITQAKREG